MKIIGRSLPHQVLATIASFATRHQVSVSSNRDDVRPPLLSNGVVSTNGQSPVAQAVQALRVPEFLAQLKAAAAAAAR